MSDQTRENSNIREDILDVLDKIFPDDVIDIWGGFEESYLADIYIDLIAKLSRIEKASLDYQRDWKEDEPYSNGCHRFQKWDDDEWDLDEPPGIDNISTSYHLFFLGLNGEQFRFDCEDETQDEDGNWVEVKGTGIIGCCVGVSLLAPFAVIAPAQMNTYEDGSQNYPDIDPYIFYLNGEPVDMEKHFYELSGEEGVEALKELANRITSVLESFGISVLPAEEAEKPVLWLKPAEDVFLEVFPGNTIKLKDAFFFRGVF